MSVNYHRKTKKKSRKTTPTSLHPLSSVGDVWVAPKQRSKPPFNISNVIFAIKKLINNSKYERGEIQPSFLTSSILIKPFTDKARSLFESKPLVMCWGRLPTCITSLQQCIFIFNGSWEGKIFRESVWFIKSFFVFVDANLGLDVGMFFDLLGRGTLRLCFDRQ